MTRPLVFATRNKGKLVELRELLPGVSVLSIDEAAAIATDKSHTIVFPLPVDLLGGLLKDTQKDRDR